MFKSSHAYQILDTQEKTRLEYKFCDELLWRIFENLQKNRFFIVITWIKFMVSINTWWKKCVKLHKRKNIWYLQFWCEKPVICSFPNKLKSTSGVGFGFLSLNWNRVLIKFSKKVGQAVIENLSSLRVPILAPIGVFRVQDKRAHSGFY